MQSGAGPRERHVRLGMHYWLLLFFSSEREQQRGNKAKLITADDMFLHNRNSMSKRERKLPVTCNGIGDVHYLAISSRFAIVNIGEKIWVCNYTEGCMNVGHRRCGWTGMLLWNKQVCSSAARDKEGRMTQLARVGFWLWISPPLKAGKTGGIWGTEWSWFWRQAVWTLPGILDSALKAVLYLKQKIYILETEISSQDFQGKSRCVHAYLALVYWALISSRL